MADRPVRVQLSRAKGWRTGVGRGNDCAAKADSKTPNVKLTGPL